eukprot:gene164-101_t
MALASSAAVGSEAAYVGAGASASAGGVAAAVRPTFPLRVPAQTQMNMNMKTPFSREGSYLRMRARARAHVNMGLQDSSPDTEGEDATRDSGDATLDFFANSYKYKGSKADSPGRQSSVMGALQRAEKFVQHAEAVARSRGQGQAGARG